MKKIGQKEVHLFRNDSMLRPLSETLATPLVRIEQAISQPTSGIQNGTIRFTADYAISRQLTLRAFYDRMVQKPLVSSFPGNRHQ